MSEIENRVTNLETQVSVVATKVDALVRSLDDFKTEMRDRDNQRAAEIRALDAKIVQIQERSDSKIDGISKEIHNLVLAAMIGIGAIAVAVVGFVISRS